MRIKIIHPHNNHAEPLEKKAEDETAIIYHHTDTYAPNKTQPKGGG